MSDNWTLSVNGRNYGPYTASQMQIFAAEGRLAPQSLVARGDENQFHSASDDPILSARDQKNPLRADLEPQWRPHFRLRP